MPAIEHATVVGRSPAPLTADVDDEVVMLDPATSQYFGLDGTGARIWALIDPPCAVESIVRRLVAEFEVDEATCLEQVVGFVQEMVDAGLMVVDASSAR